MKIFSYKDFEKEETVSLFNKVFSDSEGEVEGGIVSDIVAKMVEDQNDHDVFGFVAKNEETIIGSIFFSRLTFKSSIEAFILSPVAVDSNYQGKGVGTALIKHGLKYLKERDVQLVFTYGDPAYYSKVGFETIGEDIIQGPHPLSQPIGWLCQSMTHEEIPSITDKPRCVAALDDPKYW